MPLSGDRRGNRLAPRAFLAARADPAEHVVGRLARVGTWVFGHVRRGGIEGQELAFARVRRGGADLHPDLAAHRASGLGPAGRRVLVAEYCRHIVEQASGSPARSTWQLDQLTRTPERTAQSKAGTTRSSARVSRSLARPARPLARVTRVAERTSRTPERSARALARRMRSPARMARSQAKPPATVPQAACVSYDITSSYAPRRTENCHQRQR